MIALRQIVDRVASRATIDRDRAARVCRTVAGGLGRCLADAELVARWLPEPMREAALAARPASMSEPEELFEVVGADLGVRRDRAATLTRTVCAAIADLLPEGDLPMLTSHLPVEISELFEPPVIVRLLPAECDTRAR